MHCGIFSASKQTIPASLAHAFENANGYRMSVLQQLKSVSSFFPEKTDVKLEVLNGIHGAGDRGDRPWKIMKRKLIKREEDAPDEDPPSPQINMKSWIFEHDYCDGRSLVEPSVIVVEGQQYRTMAEEEEDEMDLRMPDPPILGDVPKVQTFLPPNYTYRFEKCEYITDVHYTAAFRIKEVDTTEKADEWMRQYEEMGLTTWRVRKTFPACGRVNIHKIEFRCQHNTDKRRSEKSKQRRTKDTNCPSIMQLTVKRYIRKSQAKRRDLLIAEWPCIIYLYHVHNHDMDLPVVPRARKKKSEMLMVKYEGGLPTDENSSPVQQLGSEIEIAVGSCLKAIFPDSNQIPSPEPDDRLVLDNFVITAVSDETGAVIHLPEQALSNTCTICSCVKQCKCHCHAHRTLPPVTRDMSVQAGDPDLGVVVYNSSENNLIEMLRQVGWVQVQAAPI